MKNGIQVALMTISVVVGIGIGAVSCNTVSAHTEAQANSCSTAEVGDTDDPPAPAEVHIKPSDLKQRKLSDELGVTYVYHYYESINGDEVLHGVSYIRGRTYIERKDYVHGVLDGLWVTMDANGVVSSIETYRKGERHGLSLLWDQDGGLQQASSYSHGKLDGVSVDFDSERLLMNQASYVDGTENGVYREWNDPVSNWPAFEKWYSNGKLNGWSAKWTHDGILQDVEHWKDDQLLKAE